MADQKLYFSRAPLMGAGKLHFLIIPQEASSGSGPRSLLGSLVAEYDSGLFGLKEVPGAQHVWKRGYVLDSIARDPSLSGVTLTDSENLASVTQSVKVEKKFGLGLGLPFPGVPVSASVDLDYSKIRSVELAFGPGSQKLYIPTGFLKAGFDYAQKHSNLFDRQLFDDDYMAVQQILLVKKMALKVESEIDFSVGFDAKADQINNLNVGVKYEKKSKKSYVVNLDDGKEYLFGIGAVQLENIKG